MKKNEPIEAKLKFFLSEDKLEKAIEELESIAEAKNISKEQIIILKRRIAGFKESYNLGLISNEECQVEKNRITKTILDFTVLSKQQGINNFNTIHEANVNQNSELKLKGDKKLFQAYKLIKDNTEIHNRKKLLHSAISDYKIYLSGNDDVLGYLNLSKSFKLLYLNNLIAKFDPEIRKELKENIDQSYKFDQENIFKYQIDQILKDVEFIEKYRFLVIFIPLLMFFAAFTLPQIRSYEGLMNGSDLIGFLGLFVGFGLYRAILDRRNF